MIMDPSVSPKRNSSPLQQPLARSPIKRESPEPSMRCSPTTSLKVLPQINSEKKDGIATTALDAKTHRQLLQQSFCIESLLKPAAAEALKIVVTSGSERNTSSSSPTGAAPTSPPSSPQSPSSSSSAAAGIAMTASNGLFNNNVQGLPRAPALVPPSALFPSHPAMYPGYPGLFTGPPHALGLGNSAGGVPTSEGSTTTPPNHPPTHQSLEGVLKNNHMALNMQTMQLEWLARTGMLYHRFPELAGMKSKINCV